MTVVANWAWWTFFVVGDDLVSCGRIVDYDVATRQLRYTRGLSDEVICATYDRVFVNPRRGITLVPADLSPGQVPDGLVELVDEDPRAYFGAEQQVLATYLPADD